MSPTSGRTALVCGISGQDGAYLSAHLLSLGYTVYGTSRDARGGTFNNLQKLGIRDQIRFLTMNLEDFRSVYAAVKKSSPQEIYFLAGQSSVGLSFEEPAETIQSIAMGTLNILEACRFAGPSIRLYHAGSGECFGNNEGEPADENTIFRPRSPYAIAKATAHWLVCNYRESYNVWACNGILFNHESPLRDQRFVSQKIVSSVRRIADGSKEKLHLGRLDISRDWGWAPEYIDAIWRMLQTDEPSDYVIATGETYRLEEFVDHAFSIFGLRWQEHVIFSEEFKRPTDIAVSRANPEKAWRELGWKAQFRMKEVVELLILGRTLSSSAQAGQ